MAIDDGEKSKWIHWLVATLWGLLLVILLLIGNNVIANERNNVTSHTKMKTEYGALDDKRGEQISIIQADVREIKTHLSYLSAGQEKQEIVNEKILDVMAGLKTNV